MLADGAMGTQLHRRGASFDRSFDVLNLESPDLVEQVHSDYVGAGADLLLTNTFCANPVHLDRWNLADSASAINHAGVALARRVASSASRTVLVAGSVGPTGDRVGPGGSVSLDEAEEAFRVQALALCDAGVDLLWLETFSDLDEIDAAVRAARSVSDLPLVASMTFTRDGYTVHGATPEVVFRHLRGRGVDGIGVNCSTGPLAVSRVVDRYSLLLDTAASVTASDAAESETAVSHAAVSDAAVSSPEGGPGRAENRPFITAMSNAGFPENRGARLFYPATPTYMADSAVRIAQAGASVIGGCCGTTPEHIAAMRKALDGHGAFVMTRERRAAVREAAPVVDLVAAPGRSSLSTALAAGRFIVTVEMEPPRSADTTELEANALQLRKAGATVLDISDIPMARLRMTGLAAASRVQSTTELETILHFPVRGRNLLRVQGDLLAAHALGIRNLFVTMGDPAVIGDYPQAFDHHDIVPTGLVRLIKERFNQGVDSAGSSIGAACEFVVGAATNLTPHDLTHEATLLHRKVQAGADFLLTQPVFDAESARAFLSFYAERFGELTVPILLGVLPLATFRHANFLNNEVPGMSLPGSVISLMEAAGDGGREVGLRIASDVVAQLRDLIAGVYVIPAFKRYDLVARLIADLVQPT